MADSLRCALHCGQAVAGFARWLNTHWRAARVICLDFQANPAQADWEAIQPAPAASADRVRILCITCKISRPTTLEEFRNAMRDLPVGLPQWVAGVVPLCQNLTALHLSGVHQKELPALPLLVHLILDRCRFTPLLSPGLDAAGDAVGGRRLG